MRVAFVSLLAALVSTVVAIRLAANDVDPRLVPLNGHIELLDSFKAAACPVVCCTTSFSSIVIHSTSFVSCIFFSNRLAANKIR